MKEQETTWILKSLSQWLRAPAAPIACPDGLSPERVSDLLERNRLLPLFHTLPVTYPAAPGWDRLRMRMETVYQRSLLQGLQQAKTGAHMMECLKAAGIPSVAVRGPFLANDLYGDPALRVSADVDILISPQDRRRAWRACRKAGYRSLDWECPLWPVDRHRIHWRLQREGDSVVCELHWAVEPVYGVMTLDYEELLRAPSSTWQFALLCLHAGEHTGDVRDLYGEAPMTAGEAAEHGLLFRWVDAAMFLRRHGGSLDWEWLHARARDRRMGASLAICLTGVRDWLGMALPPAAEERLEAWWASAQSQRSTGWRRRLEAWWKRRAGRAAGMETPLADVLYFLRPHALFFAPTRGLPLALKQLGHTVKALAVLAAGMVSFLCFAAVTGARRPFVRRWAVAAVLLASAAVARGHDFGDDYGDNASSAYPLAVGSNVTGRMEIDVDQDWFSFVADRSTNEYVVTVTTGTVWGTTAALAAPDGSTCLAVTDSVVAVTSRVSWIHVGPPATYFVAVGGFANFTTGTYTLAVSRQAYPDQDHDGMPDAWEGAWFGSTSQPPSGAGGDYDQDGASNMDEFLAGTNPADEHDRLRVTAFGRTNNTAAVTWTAVPFRTYDVEVCTNLAGGLWDSVGSVTNLAALETLRIEEVSPLSPLRFYRVRCL